MVDCPAIDTHSVTLKGSLRHQWINSYSYASIHHPPSPLHPPPSGRSTPSTLSLWIFWGFEHNPSIHPHPKSLHTSPKKKKKSLRLSLNLFMFTNVHDSQTDSQHFHIDHCRHIHDISKHRQGSFISEYFLKYFFKYFYRKNISISNFRWD